jgi:hypothetical protein
MTVTRTIAITAVLAAALVITVPTAAFASTPTATGAGYGQHVRVCAQTMGFTGQRNPGMHHGFSGWDGMTCQA